MIRAAADGSALGNPGPAGWAWYVDDDCWAAGGWKHATNNQAELMAALQLFRATAHLDDDLLVLCDSQYVINCITKWMPGWKKKGWRKADGKPVMNVELLKEIDEALVGRRYLFEWVKGHDNHPLNEAADSRARAVSEAFQRGRSIPSGPGWVRDGDAVAARAQDVAWTPGGRATAEPALPAPALFAFAFDEPAEADEADDTTLILRLSPDEVSRLEARASSRGLTLEQAIKSLI
ncbi:RNase H family protein [Lacisediminihabitans sp.]|uniref:RNase H family protein n=1 Tax=Lacisediminihabitans sp. TaxID=2787631 RepID=UPI002F930480